MFPAFNRFLVRDSDRNGCFLERKTKSYRISVLIDRKRRVSRTDTGMKDIDSFIRLLSLNSEIGLEVSSEWKEGSSPEGRMTGLMIGTGFRELFGKMKKARGLGHFVSVFKDSVSSVTVSFVDSPEGNPLSVQLEGGAGDTRRTMMGMVDFLEGFCEGMAGELRIYLKPGGKPEFMLESLARGMGRSLSSALSE